MQGSLYSKVIENNPNGRPHRDVRVCAKKLVQALHELRQLGVIHADLKPENILLRDDEVKLGDFGLSCFQDEAAATDVVQTIFYRCPEAVLGAGISLIYFISRGYV
jgi:serine/threonine protein kinase